MNDKEGRKWLLQKLYDSGIKYIAYSPFYGGYVGVKETPIISGKGEVVNDTKVVITLHGLLPDFNESNYLDIGKYLGIIDWSKIPVDAPIMVKINGMYIHRHFASYQDNRVYFYKDGKTSWTALSKDWTNQTCARLAGGDDEN